MFEGFLTELLSHDSILVLTHQRPDGDAIGSQLAIGRFLKSQGLEVILAGSDDLPSTLTWLDRSGEIELFTGTPSQLVRFGECDALLVVDANTMHRMGALATLAEDHRGSKFLIDHHPDPDPIFDYSAHDDTASSTGEIIFQLLEEGFEDELDETIAVPLYTAIMTDTGSFRFSSVDAEVHRVTSRLMTVADIDPELIYRRVYQARTLEGQHLLGQSLQTLELACDGRVGYMCVTRRMLDQTGAHSDDVDAFTDFILAISGVNTALMFLEVGRNVKISLRSQGDIPVNELAARFGGGGHRNAAGAFVEGSLSEVVGRTLDQLPDIL